MQEKNPAMEKPRQTPFGLSHVCASAHIKNTTKHRALHKSNVLAILCFLSTCVNSGLSHIEIGSP